MVKAAHSEGLLMARAAYKIAVQMKGKTIKHEKYVFAGALLIPLGKVLMAQCFPKDRAEKSWLALQGEIDKSITMRKEAYNVIERRRFLVTHAQLAAVFVSFFIIFRPIEKAIAYYRDPYYMKKVDPALFQLANIFSLAQILQENFVSTKIPLEDLITEHHQDFMRTIRMQHKKLLEILGELAKEK